MIRVDLAADPPAVWLDEPEDCQRFQVMVSGAVGGGVAGAVGGGSGLAPVIARSGMARLDKDGSHAWVFVSALRRAADGRVGTEWPEAFEAMLGYAASKGWLSPSGEEIRAHVEWASA